MGGKGGKDGAKGKGKSSRETRMTVVKPWEKSYKSDRESYKSAEPRGAGRSYNSGAQSEVVAPWTKRADDRRNGISDRGSTKGSREWSSKGSGERKGKGKGKGKDKGKDKGKRKGAAPKKSQFWVRKLEEESREVFEAEVLTGVVNRYVWKQGWGFIMPDDPELLPKKAKDMLREATEKLKADGKEPGDENLLYFRKPDVQANFRIKEDSVVTFQVYTDAKGVGACEVCDPNAEEGEEMEAEETQV